MKITLPSLGGAVGPKRLCAQIAPEDVRVTLVCNVYNQEAYLRDAAESILNQQYQGEGRQPLRVVFSDDVSTDESYEALREVVADYRGGFDVVVLRNERNIGVQHLFHSVSRLDSDFFVLAHGDDIQFPERVMHTVETHLETGASVVTTNAIVTDENGRDLGLKKSNTDDFEPTVDYFLRKGGSHPNCFGAGMAFRREVFDIFGPTPAGVRNVDFLIPFRGALLDGCAFIEEPMLHWRQHGGNANLQRKSSVAESEEERARLVELRVQNETANWLAALQDVKRLKELGMARHLDFDKICRKLERRIVSKAQQWVDVRSGAAEIEVSDCRNDHRMKRKSELRTVIPVARPLLPSADAIRPHLERIDAARIYSNRGPLARELEDRLAANLTQRSGAQAHVAALANATLGLQACLQCQGAKVGAFCLMPAWSFAASGQAALMAGLTPYFLDVEEATWALSPDRVRKVVDLLGERVGAIMAVAPFGLPLDVGAWDQLARDTGLPVVIDAAAAFDTWPVGRVPTVVSFHATKSFAIGEGAGVATANPVLAERVRQFANFGFDSHRQVRFQATNAKMSEYHAAIGLAQLDAWEERRCTWMNAASSYRLKLSDRNDIALLTGWGQDWVSSTAILRVAGRDVGILADALANSAIEARAWWGRGQHRHPAFEDCPAEALPITEALALETLGLPLFPDITADEVGRVCDALLDAVRN